MPYYAYVLCSLTDGKFYIGSSEVNARLRFHNAGLQRSTGIEFPLKIASTELLENKVAALKREKQIKSYKGGEAFKKLLGR